MVTASASQLINPIFISLVESCQKTLKNDIHSFLPWCSAFREGCIKQAGKFAFCVVGHGTQRDASAFVWKTGGPDASNGPQKAMANPCDILPRKLHEHNIHEHGL